MVAHDPFHPHSEQIRVLRTAVLMRQGEAATNVLAVVSSQRGEGRSRLAAELAISCAQLNQPTLLTQLQLHCVIVQSPLLLPHVMQLLLGVRDDRKPARNSSRTIHS